MSADTLSLDTLTGTVAASAEHSALWLRHVMCAGWPGRQRWARRPMSYIASADAELASQIDKQ